MATATVPNQLAKNETSPLITALATKFEMTSAAFLNTVIQTVFPHGKDDAPPSPAQLAMFLSVAKQYDLNPFTKEIYAFPSKGGGVVPIVSIDGWSTLVNRQKGFDGVELVENFMDGNKFESVTCKMYRNDRSHPTVITEYYEECKRSTEPWNKWPIRMLRHKAFIQCARLAFGLAGIYDEDEGERIIEAEVVSNGQDKRLAEKSGSRLAQAIDKVKEATKEKPLEEVRAEATAAQEKLNEQRKQAATENPPPDEFQQAVTENTPIPAKVEGVSGLFND